MIAGLDCTSRLIGSQDSTTCAQLHPGPLHCTPLAMYISTMYILLVLCLSVLCKIIVLPKRGNGFVLFKCSTPTREYLCTVYVRCFIGHCVLIYESLCAIYTYVTQHQKQCLCCDVTLCSLYISGYINSLGVYGHCKTLSKKSIRL